MLPSPRTRLSSLHTAAASRVEVFPPNQKRPLQGWWKALRLRLAPWIGYHPTRIERRLLTVRAAFAGAMADFTGQRAVELRAQARNARSLRDLWHMRSAVHHLICLNHSQAEAERRLRMLNQHFPTRSPRSGFIGFDNSTR